MASPQLRNELPEAFSPTLVPESWERLSIRDLLTVLFKYKVLITSVFLATVIGTLLVLWIRPPKYEVEARILIKYGREINSNPRSSLAPDANRMVAPTRPDINSEAEMIRSYALVERVVRELNLDHPVPPPEPQDLVGRLRFQLRQAVNQVTNAADELQYRLALKERLSPKDRAITEILNNLKVEGVKDSSVVDIKLQTRFRQNSSAILNHLVNAYRDERLKIERNPEVEKFFADEASQYDSKLQDSEGRLNELKTKVGTGSLPDQIGLESRLITDTEHAIDETSNRLAESRTQVALLQQQVSSEKPTELVEQVQSRNALLDDLSSKRAGLLLKRQEALDKYTDNDVHVQNVEKEIAAVDAMIANADKQVQESRTTGENGLYVDLRKQLANAVRQRDATQARLAMQQTELAQYKQKLTVLQALAPQYDQLSRDVDLDAESYKLYERNANEARAAAVLNADGVTGIAFMDPAVDPILPTGIRRVYLLAAAVFGGLMLALGLAFFAETMGHTVGTPDQLARHVEFPMLAALPFMRRKRNVDVLDGLNIEDAPNLVGCSKSLPRGHEKVILLLGANAQAGTTTVARNLAGVFRSELEQRVLLISVIDGAREPGATRLLPPPGQSATDLTLPDTFQPGDSSDHEGGVVEGYFPSHMSSDQIAAQIRNLAAKFPQFQRIVVDVSSQVPLEKRLAVARECDGVVVVVEAEKTRYEVLEWMQQEFRKMRVPVLGAVLNKRRFHIPNFVYRWI